MDVRQFIEADRVAVIKLWEACDLIRSWNDPNKDIDRKVQFQPELFFVGVKDAHVIASAMAGYDGHRGSVFYLAVHPDYQGLGYGRKLMAHIRNVLAEIGCPKLNILVRGTNTEVMDFYNSLNFATDDVVSFGKRLIPDNQSCNTKSDSR